MRLAELSAAERDYLESPLPVAETLSPLLAGHLSRVLGARMKRRVQVKVGILPSSDITAGSLADPHAPVFSWDNSLDVMWLQARLGGSSCTMQAAAAAMTKNLLRTLQMSLAETWISLPTQTLITVLSLQIETTGACTTTTQAGVVIRFPSSVQSMNQWANHIIRHAD